jgi:hypothetical protein
MDSGYTPKQFITLFAGRSNADRQVTQMFASEFGATLPLGGWGQCCLSCILKVGTFENPVIPGLTWLVEAGQLLLILSSFAGGRMNLSSNNYV